MEMKDIDYTIMPQKALKVITKPAEFFREMSKTGGFLEPLYFAFTMGMIAGIIQTVFGFIGMGLTGLDLAGVYSVGETSGFDVIIFMPIAAGIGSYIIAAVLLVIWKLMDLQVSYETAYRCGAYLLALAPIIAIVGVVPYVGGLISVLICVFYLVTASIHVYNIPSQKAWLVFGIIGVTVVLLGLGVEYGVFS
ncbi:MAG: YIP1 family protein [Smithellaceae bacterium]